MLTTGLDSQYSSVFDSKFGDAAGVHFGSIISQKDNFPGLDKVTIAVDALCLGQTFAAELAAYDSANKQICVTGPGRRRARRDLHLIDGKRNFWPGNSVTDAPGTTANPTDRPYTSGFMEQIIGGALNLVYQRIVPLGDRQRNHMLLESTHSPLHLILCLLGSGNHQD